MKSLLILLIVSFAGIKFQVRARYYIELASGRQYPPVVLYECIGNPRNQELAPGQIYRVMCNAMTTDLLTSNIYANNNFFALWKPTLPRTSILFTDDRPMTSLNTLLTLGYSTTSKDQPKFREVSLEVRGYYRSRVRDMGSYVQTSQKESLETFLAQQDVNVLSHNDNQQVTLGLFQTYSAVLEGMVRAYNDLTSRRSRDQHRIEGLQVAMRTALAKMIDPCAVITGDAHERTRSRYCSTYCSFLRATAGIFMINNACCTGLADGACASTLCVCYRNLSFIRRLWSRTNSRTDRPNVAMQQCHNAFRLKIAETYPIQMA